MSSNFLSNILIATNIILVIGSFAIVLKLSPITNLLQLKNLFIKYLKHQIDRETLIKKLKLIKRANPYIICDSILKS